MGIMKCDELTRYEVRADYDAGTINVPCENDKYGKYMLAEDVIDAIAELKQKLEDVQSTAYAESVDAGMRERRLTRALWLARAERAKEKQTHFAICHNTSIDPYLCINGSSTPTERNTTMRLSSEWSMIWKKVASKCQAKAEEYK